MPPNLPTKKSELLYFPNGDVVLQSLPKKNGVATAFKVERAILLQASSAFEKILDISPVSSQNAESYDHVPLVRLQDEADQLTMFLTALYDPKKIEWELYDYDISKVQGILLLATKYGVDDLRQHVISLLERDWPPKLDGWDKNKVDIEAKCEDSDSGADWDREYEAVHWQDTVYYGPIPDPCAIIRLARKCNVPSILPAAFYQISTLPTQPVQVISRGGRRIMQFQRNRCKRAPDFTVLGDQDVKRLRNVSARIYEIFTRCMLMAEGATIPIHNSSPEVGKKCREGFKWYKCALEGQLLEHKDDMLSLMKKPVNRSLLNEYVICEACGVAFHDSLKLKREAVWSILPVFFSLSKP